MYVVTPNKTEHITFRMRLLPQENSELELTEAMKYQRMRELNNESSRRCRRNKKLKEDFLMTELQDQKAKHTLLVKKREYLETKVRKIKSHILKYFENPQREIALARKRHFFGDKINSDTLEIFFQPQDVPSISSIWSYLP